MSYEDRFSVIAPADHVPGPRQGEWTYSHYTTLPDDERYEIIDGVLFAFPPAHRAIHQKILGQLCYRLLPLISFAGLGEFYLGPFDVELAPNTVVQPEALVVLNENRGRIKTSRVVGAPDLVVEVIEPNTVEHDRGRKFTAYARGRVREYWIVDPMACTIEVYVWDAGIYHLMGTFKGEDSLPTRVIPDFALLARAFFPDAEEIS